MFLCKVLPTLLDVDMPMLLVKITRIFFKYLQGIVKRFIKII